MNFKYFIVLCLLIVLIVPDSDCWRRRRRRRRRPAPSPPCRQVCSNYGCRHYCQWVGGQLQCGYYCGGQSCYSSCGKRDEAEQQVESDVANSPSSHDIYSYKIPLTHKFTDYDKNKDGQISYAEFKKTMPPVSEEQQIKMGFNIFDRNGNGYIDCKEFLRGKVDFAKRPTCK